MLSADGFLARFLAKHSEFGGRPVRVVKRRSHRQAQRGLRDRRDRTAGEKVPDRLVGGGSPPRPTCEPRPTRRALRFPRAPPPVVRRLSRRAPPPTCIQHEPRSAAASAEKPRPALPTTASVAVVGGERPIPRQPCASAGAAATAEQKHSNVSAVQRKAGRLQGLAGEEMP
jgi:hypothetical protein